MDSKAVEKAKLRLNQAEAKLREAADACDYQAFAGAWYFFLIAAKNVYTCLEQGSKASPQSRQWFGAKKNERKSDPLLQYLFQARDDDEHGLGEVTALKPEEVRIGIGSETGSGSFFIKTLNIDHGQITLEGVETYDGKPLEIIHTPAHVVLTPVTARAGIKYYPPTEHLGEKLPNSLPLTVGRTGLNYLGALVEEARSKLA